MTQPLTKVFLYPLEVVYRHRKGIYSMMQRVIDWTDERTKRRLNRKLEKISEGVFAAKQRLQLADDHAFKALEDEFPDDPTVKSLRSWFQIIYEDLDAFRDEATVPPIEDYEVE